MFGSLKRGLLKLAQNSAQELVCPRCLHRFMPRASPPPETVAELTKAVPCPKCGHTFRFQEGVNAATEAQANPPGPFAKPAESRIQMAYDNGVWIFQIPRTRDRCGWLGLAIAWNLLSGVLTFPVIAQYPRLLKSADSFLDTATWLLPTLFPAVGIVLLYVGLRSSFATHRLTLGLNTVQLRRKLLGHRDYEVATAKITAVGNREFYKLNYQPVFGVEITAGERCIRFGSALTDDEKNWLCWQIREFARQHGAQLSVIEAP